MHYTWKTPCDMIWHGSFLVISVLSASTPYRQSVSTSTATPSPAHLDEEDATPTQAHRALAPSAYTDTCEFKIVSPKFITYSLPFKDIYYSVYISVFFHITSFVMLIIFIIRILMWTLEKYGMWLWQWTRYESRYEAPTDSRITSWPQCITIFNNTPVQAIKGRE